jgi:hypothetical protein
MGQNESALRRLSHIVNPNLLVLMLCADAVFILLHVSHRVLSLPNVLLSLKTDGGYSEVFQYIKEYWIALVLFAVYWRTREGTYVTWALLFAYLLCDDALSIHERVGDVVERHYVPALGLRAEDFGELAFFVAVGFVFLALLTCSYLRSSDIGSNVSKDLALLLALLAFFGSAVDMAHIALPVKGLSIVEEGGEMITMSVIASYVVRLLEPRGHAPGLLWRSVVTPVTGLFNRANTRG